MQVTQQIYVAEEWVRDAHDEVKDEAHSRFEVKKAFGALKEEHKELGNKLIVVEREHSSALANLKNAEAQTENQRKLLYITEIDLATQKQLVLDLKGKLQKVKDAAKEAAQVAKVSRPKPDTRICDHDRHANIKPKPDINKNQLNFYKRFPLSFHSCFFT